MAMGSTAHKIDRPTNEPVLSYAPATSERAALKAKLAELRAAEIEIPIIIGGKDVRTGDVGECRLPHDHAHRLAVYHKAGRAEVERAIAAALDAQHAWAATPAEDRFAVFLRAAELLAGPHRMLLNAATMLGQSKNAFQAEIDSACELVDFFRFNAHFATRLCAGQPFSPPGQRNEMEYRPLEGFVLALTPFNFTSIAGNLPSAPAMLGNVVLWKPASSAVYSAYHLMRLFQEAGVPDGVIQFLPGPGAAVGEAALASPDLAGVHFTGSTAVFRAIWRTVGVNIDTYRSYPRIVGETGGKNFVFVHASADVEATAVALVRGAFEYQGQKCSAASRAYVPASLWPELRDRLIATMDELTMGGPEDFSHLINAVIDRPAFERIREHITFAKDHPDAELLAGGGCDDSIGYFVEPILILAKTPDFRTMREEIFGPVLTVYVYEDAAFEDTLELCDRTSPYGLTGAIFAQDPRAVARAREALVNAAGNFYVNDKPTGAVVGQQPFGGGRASGTNDKAGSALNLLRWLSPRAVKETFDPPRDYRYPFMQEP